MSHYSGLTLNLHRTGENRILAGLVWRVTAGRRSFDRTLDSVVVDIPPGHEAEQDALAAFELVLSALRSRREIGSI